MSVNVYLSGDGVHDRALEAFAEGCGGKLRSVKDYEPSDVAVVFGVRKKAIPFSNYRGDVIDNQKKLLKQVIVLETGYIKRGDGPENYYAAGFGGLNGRADFRCHNSPADRWEELNVYMLPWTKGGSHILLCGQVPWDASVDFTDHVQWLNEAVERIKTHTDRPIIFRPHPKAQGVRIPNVKTSFAPIERDLADAWSCVTFNSNSGVDSVLAGCPLFVDDIGSMAWSVANKNWIALDDPETPDREQWSHNLAYCQWTLEEFRQGKAWKHLVESR